MAKQKNMNEPSSWPKLYSAEQSRWQDLKRFSSFVLVFVISLAIMMVYLAIHISIYPNQINNQDSTGITGSVVSLLKELTVYLFILLIIISIGLGLVLYSSGNFLKAFYRPPDSVKPLKLITTRLIGSLPPPLSLIFNYSFVLINIVDVTSGKFNLKNHPCHWLGGPALLIVLDGAGVYLQRGNQFSRALGPGIYFLERFETIREIVDLRLQTMRSSQTVTPLPITGRTKDGIKIKFNVEISFRVMPASIDVSKNQNSQKTEAEREVEEKYLTKTPVNSSDLESIRKAVERTTVKLSPTQDYIEAKWYDGVWGTVSGELAKYITKHYLDELLVLEREDNGKPQAHYVSTVSNQNTEKKSTHKHEAGQLLSKQEREKIRANLDESLRSTTGVTLKDLRIIDFNIPPEINKQRQKMLEVESLCRLKRIKGDAEAKQILIREKARIQSQQNLIANIAASLIEVDSANFADAVLLSLSNVFSHNVEDTITSTYFAKDTFDILDQLREFLSQKEKSHKDTPNKK
ncbi:MAG: hypothetical protein JW963_20765 [Anaerolineales bacterium]|nr:hypothetical protein [Anaerolineales bacterium]